MSERQADTERLYDLLDALATASGGPRLLSGTTRPTDWPTRGVYFFFEPGEVRADGRPRVVRVGTHALTTRSRTTLWTRLSQHRGHLAGSNPGGGNHRGSIFRLHVGAALIVCDQVKDLPLSAWLSTDPLPKHRRAEGVCERAVSAYIGQMPVLCLEVPNRDDGTSDRGLVEATVIALLSRAAGGVDPATAGWLGQHAPNQAIADSGLWNVRHVRDGYDPMTLDVIAGYIQQTTFPP